MQIMMYALALLCLFLTLYDFRYRRVPNEITLPLLLIGILANFPGTPALWLGCILLLTAWRSDWMGAGDVKLWAGLLWCTFAILGEQVVLIMFITLVVTGSLQILVRLLVKKKEVIGIKLPGAWRALVYLLFLDFYSASGLTSIGF